MVFPALEPGHHIGIEADRHRLLDRPVELACPPPRRGPSRPLGSRRHGPPASSPARRARPFSVSSAFSSSESLYLARGQSRRLSRSRRNRRTYIRSRPPSSKHDTDLTDRSFGAVHAPSDPEPNVDATSIATSLVSQQSASRSQQVAIFAVKQQNELQNSLIDMVWAPLRPAKPRCRMASAPGRSFGLSLRGRLRRG